MWLKVKKHMILEVDNKGSKDISNSWSTGGQMQHVGVKLVSCGKWKIKVSLSLSGSQTKISVQICLQQILLVWFLASMWRYAAARTTTVTTSSREGCWRPKLKLDASEWKVTTTGTCFSFGPDGNWTRINNAREWQSKVAQLWDLGWK